MLGGLLLLKNDIAFMINAAVIIQKLSMTFIHIDNKKDRSKLPGFYFFIFIEIDVCLSNAVLFAGIHG